MNTQPNTDDLLSAVEEYISELPEKRRRKRTREEIYNPDLSPEAENYDKLCLWDTLTAGAAKSATEDPARALLLSWEIQGRIALLYRDTRKTPEAKANNDALQDLVKQLATMADGCECEEIQDRAATIFHALEWERQQPILFVTTGRLFKTEAEWRLFKAAKGGAK